MRTDQAGLRKTVYPAESPGVCDRSYYCVRGSDDKLAALQVYSGSDYSSGIVLAREKEAISVTADSAALSRSLLAALHDLYFAACRRTGDDKYAERQRLADASATAERQGYGEGSAVVSGYLAGSLVQHNHPLSQQVEMELRWCESADSMIVNAPTAIRWHLACLMNLLGGEGHVEQMLDNRE